MSETSVWRRPAPPGNRQAEISLMSLERKWSVAAALNEDPRKSPNWRYHKNACPHYRERWFPENNFAAGEPIYQVFCMMNTPPVTEDEQDKCLHSRFVCWRLAGKAREEQSAGAPRTKNQKAAP